MAKTKKKQQKQSDKMIVKLLILLLVVFGLCFCGLVLWHNSRPKEEETKKTEQPEKIETNNNKEPDTVEPDTPETPQSGPTTEGDENKEHAAQSERDRQNISTNDKGLKVATISLDVDYEKGVASAHGAVSNIVEEGGTCTYVFKGPNNKEINNQTDSKADFHSTLCKAVSLTKEELGVGTWQIKLIYKSNTAEGESEVKTITVQ